MKRIENESELDKLMQAFELEQGCNLISDDSGMWAVSDSGFQPVPPEGGFTETVMISSMVDKDQWRPTILEALKLFYKGPIPTPEIEE